MDVIKRYYAALKPERTYANVMTVGAGFLFASKWRIDWTLLLATLAGTTLVIMSACAANNCTDRELDARMPRTRKRHTVTGGVSIRYLTLLAVILGLAGFMLLAVYANWITVILGVVGYIDYVVLYAWSKRTTPWSTIIGTVSGAVSLIAGYTAVTDRFDITALLLGLVMVFWQMPHFYAIGIFRLKDYKAGGLPIWPVRFGVRNTQHWMLLYTVFYLLTVISFAWYSSAGIVFAAATGLSGLYLLWLTLQGYSAQQPEKWARSVFGFTLIALLIFCVSVACVPILT